MREAPEYECEGPMSCRFESGPRAGTLIQRMTVGGVALRHAGWKYSATTERVTLTLDDRMAIELVPCNGGWKTSHAVDSPEIGLFIQTSLRAWADYATRHAGELPKFF